MSHARPDPDQLLIRLHQENLRTARGKLRIYFGASAGVGKTYAMLFAAGKECIAGRDVLAGVVETHGRAETAAILKNIPQLPLASIEYKGRKLGEFDLDAALKRRPALLLVDELAHSNVAGSRHPKRWQDVEELLAAGIDVYSTLNVQHLESLNDVVGGISGVRVHETVPDTFFDRADEVVMVDTPADELIARLAAGKVYVGESAESAARNFFRKGNLMALRELALRRTADRVEEDVQSYRSERSILPVWKTEAALLCCIGPQPGADTIVRNAARLAQQLNVAWHAVYVETPRLQRLPAAVRERILKSVKLAEDLGAVANVLAAQDIAGAIIAHARHHNLSRLLMGGNRDPHWWGGRTLGEMVARRAPEIDRIEFGARSLRSDAAPSKAADSIRLPVAMSRYGWTGAIGVATTMLAWPLHSYFDLANIVMLFLLAVVGVAVRFGRGPAVLAAFINVAAFDFFFVPPALSFAVADAQYLLTFFVMLTVALITGQLTAGLRFQARVATQREARSRSLFETARELSNALMPTQVVALGQESIGREFQAQVRILVLNDAEVLTLPADASDGLDLGIARWTLDHRQAAGRGTDTLPGNEWLYMPLNAPMRARGVLALRPLSKHWGWAPEQRQQLETFAALVAMALVRLHYISVARDVTVQIESERLRNSLLAALSHDLRTPITALVGLADTLQMSTPALTAQQQALALAIRDESLRMSSLIDNLLDMARIQSGKVQLRLEWQSIEEIIGSAIVSSRAALGDRHVTVQIAPTVPLVECDASLIERVIANLLENAAKYTPPSTPVTIDAQVVQAQLQVNVSDTGIGVEAGKELAIFEKFMRGNAESAVAGVGLGLAICRAIIEAHQGHIWAEPGRRRGAVFSFTLPLGSPPTVQTDEEPASSMGDSS